jgi:hypothetical protein
VTIIKLTDLVKYLVHKNGCEVIKKHSDRHKQNIKLFEEHSMEETYQIKARKGK